MLRFLLVVAASAGIERATRLMTVPVLARELRIDADHAQSLLWHPVLTPTAAATASTARVVQASSDSLDQEDLEEEPDTWEFQDPTAESAPLVSTSKSQPGLTYMRCLGTTTTTRACHFQNVYYDLETKHFLYYGTAGAQPELFGAPLKAGDPWLKLIRGVDNWRRGKLKSQQFFLDWRRDRPPPPAKRVVDFAQPLHLRVPMQPRSFGHFLRDNLLPMVDLPLRFGRDPSEFDWVRWESNMDMTEWQKESRVMGHYRGLFNNRPSLTWQEVLDKALEGQPSSVRYIRFAEIIGGQGPVDLLTQTYKGKKITETKLAAWAHMCDPYPFTEMRRLAYRNAGLQVASVADLEPFVLFLDGRQGEKRFLANGDEILPSLRQRFPGVRMEHVQISALTLEEQMELLSKATVLVSNIGSRSFRLIYLPNGATTILVGPPEYQVTIEADKAGGKTSTYTNPTPFFEVDACWAYIGYVNMLLYRVESEAEVRRTRPWTNTKWVRDTDIVLDEGKISALLEVALQKGPGREPYTGSGVLSAYASE